MKILNLSSKNGIYSCNVYFILGNSNAAKGINTLVDVGRDPSILEKIKQTQTGIGKSAVEQVALTHGHYDHASLLPRIREAYNPTVCAHPASVDGVDRLLRDGESLKIGNQIFEVIYMPGHSDDSICLYCKSEGVLFAGDSHVVPISASADDIDKQGYVDALIRLAQKNIKAIYFGHGNPLLNNCNTRVRSALKIVENSLNGCCQT